MGEPTINNYLELAHAIVDRTCKDYRAKASKLLKNKASGDLGKRAALLASIATIRKCIYSDWFHLLGVGDADYFIHQLNQQVIEQRKKEIDKVRQRQQGSW